MADSVVIGGGLFGQVIAAQLRSLGQDVLVLDDAQPLAGSRPAACLMKPSWFSGLGKEVHEPSLRLLDELYGVKSLPFDVHVGSAGKIAQQDVFWVDPAKVLAGPKEHAQVVRIEPGRVVAIPNDAEKPIRVVEAKNIIVSAGIWTERLLPQFKQSGQRGMALLFRDSHPERGIIKPWAPYRQLVGFDRGDGLWVGDGSAIKEANWTSAREQEVAFREVKLAGRLGVQPHHVPERLHGIRPYAKAKPCLLERVAPGLWVASGGAKNGTIAAGYCAHVIGEALS